MCKYKYILFDWNGTILDDLMINIEIETCLLEKRGLPDIESVDFYLDNFGFPIIDFYKKVGFDFTTEKYEDVAAEYATEYEKRLSTATLFSDAEKAFVQLKDLVVKEDALTVHPEYDAVIGCFTNGEQKGYMLVNYTDPILKHTSRMTLQFADANSATIYLDNEVQTVALENGTCTITLTPGNAAFVVPEK